MGSASEIVQRLANIEPSTYTAASVRCGLCHRRMSDIPSYDDHADDCPWLLASEFCGHTAAR